MVKHFRSLTSVVVIGDKPKWYKGEYIRASDIKGRKEFSIYLKLMRVQGTVLYSNDDFFALQDFDHTLPNYYSGLCRDRKPLVDPYRTLYRNTPGEWRNFDIHVPMVIDTNHFEWNIDRPIKTYYAGQNKLPGEVMEDCKISGKVTYEEVIERIKDRQFFSTHNNTGSGGLYQLLNELYPDATEFESNPRI